MSDTAATRTSTTVWNKLLGAVWTPILATFFALVVGGIIVAISSGSMTLPFLGYKALFVGAFGTWYDFTESIVAAIPLMFTALAVAFAFRGGLFNIGAEGQMYAGAIASTFVGLSLTWPGYMLLPACIAAGLIGGAIWGLVPGVLKAYRGAHEVITTMMLNYVALNLLHYVVGTDSNGMPGPLQNPVLIGNPVSRFVNVFFPSIIPASIKNGRLSASLILAIVCAAVFTFVLWRTTFGYAVRATGFNVKAARYAGMPVNRTIVLTMVISGAFAGLGGMAFVFGTQHYLGDNFDNFNYGFYGIAVALLGRNTGVGAILAAILFGAFEHGVSTCNRPVSTPTSWASSKG